MRGGEAGMWGRGTAVEQEGRARGPQWDAAQVTIPLCGQILETTNLIAQEVDFRSWLIACVFGFVTARWEQECVVKGVLTALWPECTGRIWSPSDLTRCSRSWDTNTFEDHCFLFYGVFVSFTIAVADLREGGSNLLQTLNPVPKLLLDPVS